MVLRYSMLFSKKTELMYLKNVGRVLSYFVSMCKVISTDVVDLVLNKVLMICVDYIYLYRRYVHVIDICECQSVQVSTS